MDLFGPNLSHRKQARDVLFYAPSQRTDNASKVKVTDKQLFTPCGWPINPAAHNRISNVPVLTSEPKLCAYHKREREDKLWNDHKDHYKNSYKSHKVDNPGASYGCTYPKPKSEPVKIRQVEHFDAELNSIIQFNKDAQILQTQDGQTLYKELQDLKSKIAGIVLGSDPLSHQRPINPMSSLLQGLVCKGLANGASHSSPITQLWAQGGGIAEEAPLRMKKVVKRQEHKDDVS